MRNLQGFRSFCAELSSSEPSPGGGSAAAAAGAMAASLLVMVCGLTAKSKKHSMNKAELERLGRAMRKRRDELVLLVRQDAKAYDLVVRAYRRSSSKGRSAAGVQKALRYASQVPMRTAVLCIDVLEVATRIAAIGKRSASSDVGVATLLARVGYDGAAMNVRINLSGLRGSAFVNSATGKLATLDVLADRLERTALETLRQRQG